MVLSETRTAWRRLTVGRSLEADPAFREVVDRLARRGMVAAAVLGIVLVTLFVVGVLLTTGKPVAMSYPAQPKSVLVLWDKLLLVGCCVVCLVLSRLPAGVRWARVIVTALVTVAAVAMVLDDVANRDWQVRYVTLALVATVGLMPYRPLQALGLCLSVSVASALALSVFPPALGLEPLPVPMESFHFLGLVTLILTVVSGVLYHTRHGQFVARREAERLTARVQEQADALQRLEEMKDRFFANLSHEFRTPLTLLLSPLDDALEGRWGALQQPVVDRIRVMRRNGGRLLTLINQLLELSRLDAGKTRLVVAEADLVSVGRVMVGSFASMAEHRNIRLAFEAEPDRIVLHLDRNAVEQVLSNLLSNALKFTPPGGSVRLRMDVVHEGPDGRARIAVRDTGPGIDAADLTQVFDRFYRGSGPATEATVGTGIGLALSAGLVHRHGGEISVTSEEGFGSEFTVLLPMHRDDLPGDVQFGNRAAGEPELAPSRETAIVPSVESEPVEDLPPDAPRVLVVDDDPDVRDYIRELLARRYRVDEAMNGLDAVAAIESERPDLVVCDVVMPGLDGLGLCRRIRSTPTVATTPFVLLTALAEDDARIDALREGADDYLCKPFNPSELLVRVENLIELRRAMRAHLELEQLARPTEPGERSAEAVFLEQVRDVVEAHLKDTSFTVEWLADEVGLSARQLSRRLQQLTGLSAGGYVRMLRLKRAQQLLGRRAGSVSEVAYAVGFRDPAHFSRLFRQTVGVTPSAFAERSA